MKPLSLPRGAAVPHLPADRAPGPQTLRNRARGRVVGPLVGVVGTAMFAAGVWVAAGGRGARFDRREELWGGLLFAAIGLVCVYGAFAISGAGRPQRHRRLRGARLSVDRTTPRRGDELIVTFAGPSAGGDRLELGIACDERYDREVRTYARGVSMVVRQTGEETVHEEWKAVPAGTVAHEVALRIPRDAPYSYEGSCLSYSWRVSARAVRPRRPDARFDQPIWVDP